VSSYSEEGSAAIEFALVLPLVLTAALAMVQVGLIARDAVVVAHAAREGAREAAVTTDDTRVRNAVIDRGSLAAHTTTVEVDRTGTGGEAVTVRVDHRVPLLVPFLGWLLPDDVAVRASATMRQEAVADPW
jgi:Flp pilus assembly protein TadG